MTSIRHAWLLVLLGCLNIVLGHSRPLVHLDFREMTADGRVPNQGTLSCTVSVRGGCQRKPGGILAMDGLTGQVTVSGKDGFSLPRKATLSLLYRREKRSDNAPLNQGLDAFFAQPGAFVMTRSQHDFYANVHDGKAWSASYKIPHVFPESDRSWHHVVMTLDTGEGTADEASGVHYSCYVDGICRGRKHVRQVRPRQSRAPLEIGFNSHMGAPWRLAGDIAEVRVYDRILTETDIRSLTMGQNLADWSFSQNLQLAEEDRRSIAAATPSETLRTALANLAVLESVHTAHWREILSDPARHLLVMPGVSSDLTLVILDGFVHPCSWYDRKARRELLAGDNRLIRWRLSKAGELKAFSPLSGNVRSRLVDGPRKHGEADWSFSVEYRLEGDVALTGTAHCRFRQDRLEYTHEARAQSPFTTLFDVDYPCVAIRSFGGRGETLVLPQGCGVPHPRPTAGNLRFSEAYPRAGNTMQFVTYYDCLGGLYLATEDPRGRPKHTEIMAAPGRLDGFYRWRVPYDSPQANNRFEPQCRVALELFRGDWYDAGLVYRKTLAEIQAPWWRPSLPNTECPESLRENAVWLVSKYTGDIDEHILRLKQYLGQTIYMGDIWDWWEQGECNHLSPLMRQTPEWIEYVRTLRRWGVRCQPYVDGRLWGVPDRRGEDYLFTSFGHKLNVVSDGVPVREIYRIPCDVLCPATKGYQEHFFDFIKTLTMQGLDGLYVDQLGACFQPPCHQAKEHGHRYADWDAWYLKGYARLIRRLRTYWQEHQVKKVLSTEDNAEIFVGLMDALETYRWTTDGQVPLFPLVYSGRSQFYGRYARGKGARYQTLAEQLVNSEQLGAFGIGELASPIRGDLRRYAKRLAWLRKGMLDFFNRGTMARPGTFADAMPSHRRYWSPFGTQYMTKPQVQSAVWQWNGIQAAVLINTESEPIANTFRFQLPGKESHDLRVYQDDRTEVERSRIDGDRVALDFKLAPYGCLLALVCQVSCEPVELRRKLDDVFRIIRASREEDDPFAVRHLPDTDVLDPFKPLNLADSNLILGARRNLMRNQVDYVSNASIYAGTVEFGTHPPTELVVYMSCGKFQPGDIQMFVDGGEAEDVAAEIRLTANHGTRTWNDYVPLTVRLKRPLTGRHKVLFAVNGHSCCNLKSWQVK